VVQLKRIILVVLVLLSMTALNSCMWNNSTDLETSIFNEDLQVEDYFRAEANVKYTYEGHGNEYASYSVYTDYISGSRVQLRYNNGGTEYVEVLENNNKEIGVVLRKNECYYREDFTQEMTGLTDVILKEPIETGTAWKSADNKKRYISNVGVKVATPSGTYSTVEVTTEESGGKTLSYYAQNIGLVQTVSRINGNRIFSMLSKIERNVSFAQECSFFYPDVNGDKIYYRDKKIYFLTNDKTKQIIENKMKNLPVGNFCKVLGPNVVINSLFINSKNIVYIDFSEELLTEMNAGAGYESMILQCITNTLGKYYCVDKVCITIAGNPYSSGHIEMKTDEYFTVDMKNCIKLQ